MMVLGGRDVSAAISTVTKNSKTPTYWRLVARSVRVGPKVRQETVAQLGELDAEGRIAVLRHLADSLVGLERQPGLFDEDLPTEPVTVVPSRLRLERGRRFGDVWLAWETLAGARTRSVAGETSAPGREDVPWSLMAAVLVIATLSEPSSELHIAEDWFRDGAWTTCLGCPRPRSTTTDSIARWTGSCRTRTRSKRTSRNASELCSGWNMIF